MYKAKISIHEITWSGFAVKTGEPSSQGKEPYTLELLKKEEIVLEFAGKKYTVQVSDINENSIELYTDNLSVKSKDYGVSIHPEPHEVTIQVNQTEIFYTPTLDVGAKWEITLLSVERLDVDKTEISNKKESVGNVKLKIRIPKAYFAETQKIVKQLEEKLKTKIIVYYVPRKNWIDQEHPDYFLEQLKDLSHQKKLSLVIYSSGGDPMASLRIATLLRNYCEILEVIVPSICISAATQLALAADKILFTPLGYLGPIDAQIADIKDTRLTEYSYNQISFDSFRKAHDLLEQEGFSKPENAEMEGAYRTLFKYVHPLVYAEVDRLSKRSKMTAEIMMRMHPQSFENNEKIASIASHLVFDYPTHVFPIQYERAKQIGLPVEKLDDEISYMLWNLLKFYKVASREVVTHVHTGLYHVEETPVIIETFNKRIIKRYSFNQQYFLSERKWQTIHDNTQWAKLTPSNSFSKPYDITPVEAEETKEYQIPLEGKENDQLLEDPKS